MNTNNLNQMGPWIIFHSPLFDIPLKHNSTLLFEHAIFSGSLEMARGGFELASQAKGVEILCPYD